MDKEISEHFYIGDRRLIMTFSEWLKNNEKEIYGIKALSPTAIKELLEDAWHDGFRMGFASENKLIKAKDDPFGEA